MAYITDEVREAITIKDEFKEGVPPQIRVYVHQRHSQVWQRESPDDNYVMGFEAPRDTPEYPHLPSRNGWRFSTQSLDYGSGTVSTSITAEREGGTIHVDLERRLRGGKTSLLDFFATYQDCIHSYRY